MIWTERITFPPLRNQVPGASHCPKEDDKEVTTLSGKDVTTLGGKEEVVASTPPTAAEEEQEDDPDEAIANVAREILGLPLLPSAATPFRLYHAFLRKRNPCLVSCAVSRLTI